jgi:hydroxyacylglutathione hydrolase
LQIRQFSYGADNFAYLVYGERTAVAIDGGAVDDIFGYIDDAGLVLAYVIHTHTHADHTAGSHQLLKRSDATRLSQDELIGQRRIMIDGNEIHIYHTPGHTQDSVVFYAGGFLVTGDTLFNATVGNCFSGDLKAFYHSISYLLSFPDDTLIYAGHDYVNESLTFAKLIDPDNKQIDIYKKNYNPDLVVSTLGDEKKVNPYLRFNAPAIVSQLTRRGLPTDTEYRRWNSLMSIE